MAVVSIIIPVYKVEKYLSICINSVLNQTFRDFELILVDDGSPDGSGLICDEYAKADSRVKVIHKENGGVSSARNAGIKFSTGKYLLFIDSDDTVEPELLQNVVPVAEKSDLDIVIFGMRTIIFENEIKTAESFSEDEERDYNTQNEILQDFSRLSINGKWNFPVDKLYRSDIVKNNFIYFNSFYDGAGEDTVFLLDLLTYINKVKTVKGYYYNYFIRDNQSTVKSFLPNRYKKFYGRYKKVEELIYNNAKNDNNVKYLYDMYCTMILWAYEFMFHKDCKLSFIERYKYIKRTFSIRRETKRFRKDAFSYFTTQNVYKETSKISKIVVRKIIFDKYFCAALFHIVALLKNKGAK